MTSTGYAQITAPVFSSIFVPPAPHLPIPPVTPDQSVFNEALSVTHALNVPSTTETLKRLERVDSVTEDPRPAKRQRSPRVEKPRDDNVVSLGSSSLDEDLAVAAGLSGPTRYGAISLEDNNTDLSTESKVFSRDNGSPLDTCKTLINFACLSLDDDMQSEEWMLDSGASMHFTYEAITPIPCKTATSVTSIIGKGAIILDVSGWIVRIQPVYHIPDITSKLLLLKSLQVGEKN